MSITKTHESHYVGVLDNPLKVVSIDVEGTIVFRVESHIFAGEEFEST